MVATGGRRIGEAMTARQVGWFAVGPMEWVCCRCAPRRAALDEQFEWSDPEPVVEGSALHRKAGPCALCAQALDVLCPDPDGD